MAKKVMSSGKMYTSKNKGPLTPWLKNAMRSIGVTSSEVIKDLSPNIYEVASSGVQTLADVRKITRRGTSTSAVNALGSNRYVKMGQETIKNALDDIKTGNLNNTERQSKALEKSLGLDDIEKDFGTFMDDSDWDDESPAIQQYISTGADEDAIVAISSDLSDQIKLQTENQLKVAKANIDTMVSIGSAQMIQSQEIGNNIVTHLGNISNSLASLVEYNNESMNRFIESSIAFMERMGAKEEESTSFDDKIDATSVYNNSKGGLNLSTYKKYVLQQFQKEFKGSQLGFISSMIAENPDIITSNPIGFVSKMVVGGMVPQVVKETMAGVEEAFSGFVPTMLAKVADLGDTVGDSLKDNLLRMFGKTFGVRAERGNAFDLSGAATKDAAIFDKMTRHSIVELMPKYLRESSSYLKDILDILGGNSASAINKAQAFDYQQGKYRSVEDINNDVYGTIKDTVVGKLDMSKFGSGLRQRGTDLSQNLQEQYNKVLDNFFLELERRGKALDVTNFNDGSDLKNILSDLDGDSQIKKYLEGALRASSQNKSASLNANVAIQQAVAARKNMVKSIEEDPYSWNLYTAASDKGESIDDQIKIMGKSSSISSSDKRAGTPVSLLNDIKGILARGINVKILKGSPFGPYSPTQSSDITPVPINSNNNSNNVNGENTSGLNGTDIENKTAEDIARMMQENDTLYSNQPQLSGASQKISSAGEHIQNAMYAIAYGNSSLAFDEIGSIVGDKIVGIGSKFKQAFLDPMIKSVLGEKDSQGYSKDGLLSGVQNKFLDTYRSFQREFSGKGYIDSQGNRIEDKKDGEESVVGNIKNIMKSIKKNTMDYILGEEEVDKDGNPTGKRTKGHGAIGFMMNSIKDGFDGFAEFIFGKEFAEEDKDAQRKTVLKYAKDKISEVMPSGITGSIVGGLGGLMTGGSLLGTLVGGPIGGALIGGTVGIVSKSSKFQDWFFGKEDEETHERMGGFLSKELQDTLKKNKVNIIGGAAVGVAKNAVLGSGGGLLGSLVGGPIAGALIGGTVGYVAKTKQFQEFLYGTEITDKDGNTKKIGGVLNAFNGLFKKNSKDDTASGSKLLGMGLIGAGAGAAGASILGSMGLLGSLFTPFGPVGGALAGLVVSMKASNKAFRQYLFGADEMDENGNIIGHKNGVLQKFGNMLQVELFEPMRDGLQNFAEDAQDFIIDKMLAPVEFAVAPFVERLSSIADGIKTKVGGMLDTAGKIFKDNVVDPIVGNVRKYILNPMKTVFGGMFKAIWGVSKMMISAPFNALSLLTNFNDARNRRDSRKRVMSENLEQNGFLKGMGQNLAIRLNMGNARKDAEYKYTDYAEDWDERKRQYAEDRETRTQEHRDRLEERRRTSKNRRMMGRWTGYDQIDDTEENRELAQQKYDEYRRGHRLSTLFKSRKLKFEGDPISVDKSSRIPSDNERSASDVLKETNTGKVGVIGGILKEVHSIAQAITGGRSPFGRSQSDSDITEDNENKQKNDKSRRTESSDNDRNNEENSNDDVSSNVWGRASETIRGWKNNIKSSLNIKEGWDNSYAKQKLVSAKDFLKNLKLPGFAEGTDDAPKGPAIVGENGPELVRFNGGEKVTPNEKPIKVSVVDMAEGLVGKVGKFFSNIFGRKKNKSKLDPNKVGDIVELGGENLLPGPTIDDDGDTVLDALSSKRRNSMAQDALDRVRKAKNYEANQKARKDAEKEEREIRLLEVTEEQRDQSKGHFNLWSSIFSKKGLITAALLALSPLIIKFLKNFNLGQILKDALGDLGAAFGVGPTQTENGESAGTRLKKNFNELGNFLSTGNAMEWIAPNGELNHMSGAKANVLTQHVVKPLAKAANWGIKKVTGKTGRQIGKDYIKDQAAKRSVKKASQRAAANVVDYVDDGARYVTNYADDAMRYATKGAASYADDVVEYGAKSGSKYIDDAARMLTTNYADDVARIGTSLSTDVISSTAKNAAKDMIIDVPFTVVDDVAEGAGKALLSVTDDVAKVAASNKQGLIAKVSEALRKFLSSAVDYLKKKGHNVANAGKNLVDDVLKVVSLHFPKISAKISSVFGKISAVAAGAAAAGATVIGYAAEQSTWVTLGAINGLTGAARLFQVDKSYVDVPMRLISAAIGGLAATDIGSIVDIVNELVVDVLGVDFIHELAVVFYHVVAGDNKYNELKVGQADFTDQYNEYREGELEKQRKTFNAIHGQNIGMDEYKAAIESGNISVDYDSFADFNDQKHQTLGSSLYNHTLKPMGKGISSAWNGTKSFIAGKTTEYYMDENGNKYVQNSDGTFEVYSPDGEDLGYIAEKELPESARANKITEKTDGLVQKAGKGLSAVGRGIGNAAKSVGSGIKKGASVVGNFVKNTADTIGSGIIQLKDNAVEAGTGLAKGLKTITTNFYRKDVDFKSYFTADVNTISEDNPLHGIIGGLLNVSKVVLFPKLLIAGIGKNIAEALLKTVKSITTKTTSVVRNVASEQIKLMTISSQGDLDALNTYSPSISEDNPIGGITKAGLTVAKYVNYPSTFIHFLGNKIAASVKSVAEKTSAVVSASVNEYSTLQGIADSGDVEALGDYEPAIDESTPLSGVISSVFGGLKYVMYPKTYLHHFGNILKEKFLAGLDVVKTVAGDTKTGVGDIFKLAITGKQSDMIAYEGNISEDNPVGGFVSSIFGVEKFLLTPMATFTTAAKDLAEKVSGGIKNLKDMGGDVKDFIVVLNKYTDPDKSMNDYKNEKMNGADDDPARTIVGVIIKRVMKIYVDIVRGIRKLGDWAGDKIDSIKEAAGDVKDWAVETGGNVVSGAKNAVSNAGSWIGEQGNKLGTAIMNWGRGGKGPDSDTVNNFPYYSQKDPRWANVAYDEPGKSRETISDAGCGPDAMAMVATKMTGRKITPIEVARDAKERGYRDSTGTNWDFVDSAANKYGMSTTRVENPGTQYIQSELSKGRPVMLSGVGDGVTSPYTSQGHYVVAVGTSGNDVIINDPRGSEHSGRYDINSVANNTGAAWSFNRGGARGGRGPSNNKIIRFPGGGAISNISAEEEAKLEKARQLVVSTMKSLEGRLHYTQDSRREQVIQGVAGDCSSTCRWVYKNATGIDPGSYTGAQITSSVGSDVDNTPGCPKETNLLPGDLLFFAGKNGSVGHVEMYIGGGQIMGHGGPNWNDLGPKVKSMGAYCNERNKSGKPYMKARRYILAKNADHVKLNTAGSVSVSNFKDNSSGNSTGGFFDKMGNFFSAFAEKAWTGLTTGVWDTDYSSVFNGATASTDSDPSASTGSSGITQVDVNNGDLEKSTFNFFVKNGFTPAAAAGIMGNIYQESKFNPSLIQGNGKGPAAGLFQWENYNTKSKRWKNLSNYASSKGKQWTDPSSQLEFALSEMMNDNWMWKTPSNKSLKSVSSLNEYKTMNNPGDAAIAFSNHFERPGTPMNSVRKSAAQKYFDTYKSTDSSKITSIGDLKRQDYESMAGGRGGEPVFELGQKKYYTNNQSNTTSSNNSEITFGTYTPKNRLHTSNNNPAYQSAVRNAGGRGATEQLEKMLTQVINLLTSISTSSSASAGKLDMLKGLSSIGTNITAVTSNSQGPTIVAPQKTSASDMLLGAKKSNNEALADRIASGQ